MTLIVAIALGFFAWSNRYNQVRRYTLLQYSRLYGASIYYYCALQGIFFIRFLPRHYWFIHWVC